MFQEQNLKFHALKLKLPYSVKNKNKNKYKKKKYKKTMIAILANPRLHGADKQLGYRTEKFAEGRDWLWIYYFGLLSTIRYQNIK